MRARSKVKQKAARNRGEAQFQIVEEGAKNDGPSQLAAHVLATLPDSISKRQILLEEVIAQLPRDHEWRLRAALLLRQLQEHERAQWQCVGRGE